MCLLALKLSLLPCVCCQQVYGAENKAELVVSEDRHYYPLYTLHGWLVWYFNGHHILPPTLSILCMAGLCGISMATTYYPLPSLYSAWLACVVFQLPPHITPYPLYTLHGWLVWYFNCHHILLPTLSILCMAGLCGISMATTYYPLPSLYSAWLACVVFQLPPHILPPTLSILCMAGLCGISIATTYITPYPVFTLHGWLVSIATTYITPYPVFTLHGCLVWCPPTHCLVSPTVSWYFFLCSAPNSRHSRHHLLHQRNNRYYIILVNRYYIILVNRYYIILVNRYYIILVNRYYIILVNRYYIILVNRYFVL